MDDQSEYSSNQEREGPNEAPAVGSSDLSN